MAHRNASPRQSGYADGQQLKLWEVLYESALCEFDRNKLRESLQAAVTAIDERLRELANSDNPEALQCLSALETLRTLSRLELNSAA